jgi:hypothetical protein
VAYDKQCETQRVNKTISKLRVERNCDVKIRHGENFVMKFSQSVQHAINITLDTFNWLGYDILYTYINKESKFIPVTGPTGL